MREAVSSPTPLWPPALPCWEHESGPQGTAQLLLKGKVPHSDPIPTWIHGPFTLSLPFLSWGEVEQRSPSEHTVNQVTTSSLAFHWQAPSLTFHLLTNPQLHRLHFCMIFLLPPGSQRDQGTAQSAVFLEVLLSFSVTFSPCHSRKPPWMAESEFQISLKLCWLWRLIPFTSAICCLGIFRMGCILCNCVIQSQHVSVIPHAFVLNCWLVCKVIKKSWREKRDVRVTLWSEHHVIGSSVHRRTLYW